MIDIFALRIILSFFIGGIWIAFLTIFSEKYGSKLGGAIAGIPATMVVTLLFIGISFTPQTASEATTLIPIVLGINAIFVISYIFLSRINFYFGLFMALWIWGTLSFIVSMYNLNIFFASIIIYFIIIFFSYLILQKKLNISSNNSSPFRYRWYHALFRAIIGGSIISFAIYSTKAGGPLIGGIFATFPALTIAMILIIKYSSGEKFVESLLKNFIISGTINVLAYICVVRYAYPYIGLIWGTILAFIASLFVSFLAYQLINKRLLK